MSDPPGLVANKRGKFLEKIIPVKVIETRRAYCRVLRG